MNSALEKINPALLALIEGKNSSLLPFVRELLVLECHVAGTTHHPVKELEPAMTANDKFILFREPENEHDPFAVAIYTKQKKKLGYLPRDRNETIARLMDAGKMIFATLITKEWVDEWLKLSVKVFLIDKP